MTNSTQSKKPKRTSSHAPLPTEGTLAILNRLLLTPVSSTANGKKTAMPPLKAIVSQLMRKALDGDACAVRVLERFRHFAIRDIAIVLEVEFVDDGPVETVASGTEERKIA